MVRFYIFALFFLSLPMVSLAQWGGVDELVEAHSEADGVMHQDVSGAMLWLMRKSDKSGKLDDVDRVNLLIFKDIARYSSFASFTADMLLTFDHLGITKAGVKREKDANMIVYAKEQGTPDRLYMIIEPDDKRKSHIFMAMDGDIEAIIEAQKNQTNN